MNRYRIRAQGWSIDSDGWWNRPAYKRDAVLGGPFIGNGHHAFFEDGRLYCRNRKQAMRLDQGRHP